MPEKISGYQNIIPGAAPAKRENASSGMAMAARKETQKNGTTWTKTIPFKIAILVLFDVSPIHMPNHIKAVTLASVVRSPPIEVKIIKGRMGA